MTYPTLYKEGESWWIELEMDHYAIFSEKNGKKTISNWRQSDTPNQDIKFIYRLKKIAGYSLSSKPQKQPHWFKPMMPLPFKSYKNKLRFPCLVHQKLDNRLILGSDFRIRLGRKYHTNEIEKCFRPLFERFPQAILDGQIKDGYYQVYDGYGFGATEDDVYQDRIKTIETRLENFNLFLKTEFLEANSLTYLEYICKTEKKWLIRTLGRPYLHKKTKFLLEKIK